VQVKKSLSFLLPLLERRSLVFSEIKLPLTLLAAFPFIFEMTIDITVVVFYLSRNSFVLIATTVVMCF